MTDRHDTDQERDQFRATTSPTQPTKDATRPPANPDAEREEVERSVARLEQAGGGH